MHWNKSEYLASWPKALPYPYALARSKGPVPNRSSVDWPQAQWAPLYLSPGSPSVQPYRYPADGRQQSIVPDLYMVPPTKCRDCGPAGDIVATPYGSIALANSSKKRLMRKLAHSTHQYRTAQSRSEKKARANQVGELVSALGAWDFQTNLSGEDCMGCGDYGCYGCGYGCMSNPGCGCSSCSAKNNPTIMERWTALSDTQKFLLAGGAVALAYAAYTGKLNRLFSR